MKLTNPTIITALATLLENGGIHAGVTYLGAARDQEGNQFLLRESNYPVGFSVDQAGDIVLNSNKVKGATKFQHQHDVSVKETFSAYCEELGLGDNICFQLNSLEKAMTIAMLNNVARQVLKDGEGVVKEDVIERAAATTMAELQQTVATVAPEFAGDEDLVAAMIAAGMTPVRSTQDPAVSNDSSVRPVTENMVKVPLVEDNEEEDLIRSERLISVLRGAGDLNESETEMLEQLEAVVDYKRARQQELKRVMSDRSSTMSRMRAHLLTGRGGPMGLQRRYAA